MTTLDSVLEKIPVPVRRKIGTSAKEIKELLDIGCTPEEVIQWAEIEARKKNGE